MFALFLIPLTIITVGLLQPEPPPPEPPKEKIILLPDADGNVGEVLIKTAAGEKTLNTAYGAVEVSESGEMAPVVESAESIRARYGDVLDAAPPEPVSYVVYFSSGSSEQLTAASEQTFAELRLALAARPAPEILVIGHTDTVGNMEDNDRLSLKRATTVLDMIRQTGVSAASLEASGRGERELLVPTADRVNEPRNRRVEISIR